MNVVELPRQRAPQPSPQLPKVFVFDDTADMEMYIDNRQVEWGAWLTPDPHEKLAFVRKAASEDFALARTNGYVAMSIPRGLRWADLPMVSDAKVRWRGNATPVYSPKLELLGVESFGDLVQAAEVFVISWLHEWTLTENEQLRWRFLRNTYAIIREMRGDKEAEIYVVGNDHAYNKYSMATLGEFLRPHLLRGRFYYSYALNVRAIMTRALVHAWDRHLEWDRERIGELLGAKEAAHWEKQGRTNRDPEDDVNHVYRPGYAPFAAEEIRRRIASGLLMPLASPAALQMLFHIKRNGPMPLVDLGLRWTDNPGRGRRIIAESREISWLGTGAHKPKSRPADHILRDDLDYLIQAGLLDVDRHSITITARADYFLSLLHKDNEDPDALLRWSDKPTIEESKAMDDWIMRQFRKMKNRLAGI